MNFNTFALLALLAPVAVQSHATEIRHCITSDTVPKLRIFVAHTHGRTNTPALYDYTNPSDAGNLTFTKNNEAPISLSPNSLIFDVNATSIWTQGCQGNSTLVASTATCLYGNRDDWVVFDFPLTSGVPVAYKMEYGTDPVLIPPACSNIYPVTINASVSASPSDSPSDQPSLVPSRSSKKGKKEWRAERLARDPNFPTFAPKSAKVKSAKDKSSKSTKVPASILKSSIYTDGEE